VLVAVSLSILVALHRIARPHDAVLGDYPGLDGWVDARAYPDAVPEPGLLVYRFDAPLFFVNAEHFRERVEEAVASNPGDEDWLVLDFEGVGAIDATAVDVLAEFLQRVPSLGVRVIAVARANEGVLDRLRRGGLTEPAGVLRVFPTINSAVRAYRRRHE
jgi:SulP family sulfate permease